VVLTEICLRGFCSCQEILRRNGRGQHHHAVRFRDAAITNHDRAAVIFDAIDSSGDATVDLRELCTLMLEFGVGMGEMEIILSKLVAKDAARAGDTSLDEDNEVRAKFGTRAETNQLNPSAKVHPRVTRADSGFIARMARATGTLILTRQEFYEFCPEFWKFLFSTLRREVQANSKGVKTSFEKMACETRCPFAQLSHGFEHSSPAVGPQVPVSDAALDELLSKAGLPKQALTASKLATGGATESALVPRGARDNTAPPPVSAEP
jgi:hypothetical protein